MREETSRCSAPTCASRTRGSTARNTRQEFEREDVISSVRAYEVEEKKKGKRGVMAGLRQGRELQ